LAVSVTEALAVAEAVVSLFSFTDLLLG